MLRLAELWSLLTHPEPRALSGPILNAAVSNNAMMHNQLKTTCRERLWETKADDRTLLGPPVAQAEFALGLGRHSRPCRLTGPQRPVPPSFRIAESSFAFGIGLSEPTDTCT